MAIYTNIQATLHDLIVTNFPELKVVGENERYKPLIDVPWAQTTLIPATTTRQTLGETGQFQYSGLFQVSFFVPAQSGVVSNDLVDRVVELVQGQPLIDINDTALHLRQVTRLTSKVETDWYHIACRIEWWAYA